MTTDDPILANLNPPQREAVLHRDGALLVLAGPGSGKTRVITRRCAQLVRSGVAARHVLAITFTNKAADEMRRRIDALGVSRGMTICTFHSLGVRLLREFGPRVGVQPGFSIYDDADQKRVIKEALAACKVESGTLRPDLVSVLISGHKNQLRGPRAAAEVAELSRDQLVARIYERYQALLEQNNAVDFDDLLMKVALLLSSQPDVAELLGERFRYLLIDEYQDTNHAQYTIARLLSEQHGNLCATGDPDQSIYAWRGANIGNILEFERDYPAATVIRLEQNYRSRAAILRAASQLIRHNQRRRHKELWTENEDGEPVEVWEFPEGRDEAETIADTIQRLRGAGLEYNDFAIFYRINAVSRGLEESLRMRGIPYKIARGVEFYNRKEIRDTLAYLRVLVNPADEVALLRIINTPARGIGKTTIDRLILAAGRLGISLRDVLSRVEEVTAIGRAAARKVAKFAELLAQLRPLAQLAVAEAVSEVLERSGLEAALREEDRETEGERLANVEELVTAATRYASEAPEPSLEDFLQRISLTSDQDAVDETEGVVMLMTLHAAKGLEFPVVFIAGAEQGMLPHERALRYERGGDDLEEERRLAFVGVTRAEQRLFISHAQNRLIRGRLEARAVSQFLRELPDDACVWRSFGVSIGRRSAWSGRGRDEWSGHPSGRPGAAADDWGAEGVEVYDVHAERSPGQAEADEGDASFDFGALRGGAPPPRERRSRARSFDADGSDGAPDPDLGERVYSPDDPAGTAPGASGAGIGPAAPTPRPPRPSPYAGWTAGMPVEHAEFGVGELIWVRPSGGRTRAAVRFPAYGQKTFVLEYAPLRPLRR